MPFIWLDVPAMCACNIQNAGIDLPQCAERRVRPRLNRGRICRVYLAGLCARRTDHEELGGSNGHDRVPKKRRRSWLIASDIYLSPIGFKSMLPRVAWEDSAHVVRAVYLFPISAVI